MNGRRAVIGLSLLCALLFSAFAAQSASATVGTTAFTCVSGGGEQEFADAHCDTPKAGGGFGHAAIGEGTTSVDLTNAKTANSTTEAKHALFKTSAGGIALEITCATAQGTGSIKNIAIGPDGGMAVEGSEGGSVTYSNCKMPKPKNATGDEICEVHEPIVVSGSAITRVNQETAGIKDTMGVEFRPKATQPFTELKFTNRAPFACFLHNKTVAVTGTAMATGARGPSNSVNSSGATLLFTTAMTKETLKFGAAAAEFEASITVPMSGGGNPVTATTTAS